MKVMGDATSGEMAWFEYPDSPTLPIRVGLVGAGRWGQNYLRLGITDFYDPGVAGSHSELDSLLSTVEAVVVATPARTHAEVALSCLRAGCDVLVEKPFTTTVADAERILAAQGDRIVMSGHLMLYHPAYTEFRKRYDGEPIHAVRMGGAWQPLDPLFDLGAHDLAMVIGILGVPSCTHKVGGVYLVGEAGRVPFSIATSYNEPRQRTFRAGKCLIDRDDLYYDSEYVEVPKYEPLRAEFEEFIECCQTRRKPVSDGVMGLEVVRGLT